MPKELGSTAEGFAKILLSLGRANLRGSYVNLPPQRDSHQISTSPGVDAPGYDCSARRAGIALANHVYLPQKYSCASFVTTCEAVGLLL